MQFLSDEKFVHYDYLNFTNFTFTEVFKEKIELLGYNVSEKAMGYFDLSYLYLPKQYNVFFEHDRLFFSIRIINSNGGFTSVNQMTDEVINNALKKPNIEKAIKLLAVLIEKDITFYNSKKQSKCRK